MASGQAERHPSPTETGHPSWRMPPAAVLLTTPGAGSRNVLASGQMSAVRGVPVRLKMPAPAAARACRDAR